MHLRCCHGLIHTERRTAACLFRQTLPGGFGEITSATH
jgi:hypothetical protein